jgi:hypothetical protein
MKKVATLAVLGLLIGTSVNAVGEFIQDVAYYGPQGGYGVGCSIPTKTCRNTCCTPTCVYDRCSPCCTKTVCCPNNWGILNLPW